MPGWGKVVGAFVCGGSTLAGLAAVSQRAMIVILALAGVFTVVLIASLIALFFALDRFAKREWRWTLSKLLEDGRLPLIGHWAVRWHESGSNQMSLFDSVTLPKSRARRG